MSYAISFGANFDHQLFYWTIFYERIMYVFTMKHDLLKIKLCYLWYKSVRETQSNFI